MMNLSAREFGGILFGAMCASIMAYVFLGIAWAVALGLLAGAAWCGALLRGFSHRELVVILGGALFAFAVAFCHLRFPWALCIGLLMGAVFAAVRCVAGPKFFEKIMLSGLVASIAAYGFSLQVHFGAHAVAGTARVEDSASNPRLGRIVSVVHEVDGKPVRATVQTYFFYPEKDSDLSIRYLPEEPTRAEMDSLWERYLLSGSVFLLSGGILVWEILSLVATRGPTER